MYYDIRNLREIKGENCCPIKDCTSKIEKAPSQWGDMPFCPEHCIRIHKASKTFVYYNGHNKPEREIAATRNILFNKEHFTRNFLDKSAKAESHRICHETSEDALSWNVFTELFQKEKLTLVAELFTNKKFNNRAELYLWGKKIDLKGDTNEFPSLKKAKCVFEKDLTTKFVTEPDIILYIPTEALILVEAKLTSSNPVATTDKERDVDGEKPKSKFGLIKRYNSGYLKTHDFEPEKFNGTFFSQIYRNLIFASYMADDIGVEWHFCNLISQKQIKKSAASMIERVEEFYKGIIIKELQNRATICSWEKIFKNIIENDDSLNDLNEYMKYKTANLEKAFDI